MATKFLLLILAIGALIAFMVPVALYFAWAATHLWAWFIVPTFGLPQITILQAWGISLAMAALRPKLDMSKTEKDWATGLMAIILGPLLLLGLGYAIRFWWM